MPNSRLSAFRSAAAAAALEMLENASYIKRELPSIGLSEPQVSAIERICSALVGTKHDVINEVHELAERGDDAALETIRMRVERIVSWLGEDLPQLHAVVKGLEAAGATDPASNLAWFLVSESAVNVYRSVTRAREAADAYLMTVAQRAGSEVADDPSTSMLERAIELAAKAHAGQSDKAGQPYILHPLRVMLAVRGNLERMTAVLHDVVEDTPVTLQQLAAEGFLPEVIAAVEALTKRDGETRLAAAARARANPIARIVKLAEVADNMDLWRIANPKENDFERLGEYALVKALLSSGQGLR